MASTTKATFTPAAKTARARRTVDPAVTAQRAIADAKEQAIANIPKVRVNVPSGFRLTDDGHEVHEYAAGVQMMRVDHADHWYAAANGVTRKE